MDAWFDTYLSIAYKKKDWYLESRFVCTCDQWRKEGNKDTRINSEEYPLQYANDTISLKES